MARETSTRGRSALNEHDSHRTAAITRIRPTGRGAAVAAVMIALIVAEIVTGDAALLLVLVVVALPLTVAPVVVLVRARRSGEADLQMMLAPPLVPVGTPCELLLQLTRSSRAEASPMGLERPSDHWSAGFRHARSEAEARQTRRAGLAVDVGRLIRWDRMSSEDGASSVLPLPTRRRGVFTFGPLRLWVHDPFGLFGLPVAVAAPVTLVVHPPTLAGTTRSTVRPGLSGSMPWRGGTAISHSDDPGGEWSGLRPYEPGDRLHLLSWQAEARLGALLVHDFRPDSKDVVSLVLDDRAGVHRREVFEKALGVLYGLAHDAEERASDYDVSTLSGRHVEVMNTPEGQVELATFLAETQPTRPGDGAAPPPSALPDGALLITTATALTTLPASLDHASVVVVE